MVCILWPIIAGLYDFGKLPLSETQGVRCPADFADNGGPTFGHVLVWQRWPLFDSPQSKKYTHPHQVADIFFKQCLPL